MTERVQRYYSREEEFVDEFSDAATVASAALGGAWVPHEDCDDAARHQRRYFVSTGELIDLVFDGAAVFHDARGFSSVQIILRSSKRIVTLRVTWQGKQLVAEKIVDRPVNDDSTR